tara:strand:+ start:526 stop:864 length:339 start_codon:yes stop_codon:yes gene_type:complete
MDIYQPVIIETEKKLIKVKSDKKKLLAKMIIQKRKLEKEKNFKKFPAIGDKIFLTQVELSKKDLEQESLEKKLKNTLKRRKDAKRQKNLTQKLSKNYDTKASLSRLERMRKI